MADNATTTTAAVTDTTVVPTTTATATTDVKDTADKTLLETTDGTKPSEDVDAKPPIEYTDFKLPEDFKIDDKMFSDFKAVAAESGLPQDQAQKFIDMHVAMEKQRVTQEEQQFTELQNTWKGEVSADKEFGGDKLPQTLSSIAKVIDRYGGKDAAAIRQAFGYTGAGNNPQIVRLMARMASALNEGSAVPGTKPAPSKGRTAADTLYPNGGGGNLGNQHL